MNFLSLVFITALPVIVLLYRVFPKRIRPALLLISSWLFYLHASPDSYWILVSITVIAFAAGLILSSKTVTKSPAASKIALLIALTLVLSFLFAYKYLGISKLLPIGISFYTFQAMSYLIDVYKGRCKAEKNFFDFSLFIAFFPQLVAGPIERPSDLLPQLKKAETPSKADFSDGSVLLITGYFKKIVVADYLAPFVDRIFASNGESRGLIVLLGAFLFALQIYADFSGYSDIARGCARLLGIELKINFRHPYLSDNIRDFWRRWHITLTGWLTDYVYIPLGGNKKGSFKKAINTLIVFALSGIWHGAGLKFVLWGLGHGLLILLEDLAVVKKIRSHFPKPVNIIINFVLVSLLWIFFRAGSLMTSLELMHDLFVYITEIGAFTMFTYNEYLLMGILSIVVYLVPKYTESKNPKSFLIMYLLSLVIIASKINQIQSGIQNSFIYFRF